MKGNKAEQSPECLVLCKLFNMVRPFNLHIYWCRKQHISVTYDKKHYFLNSLVRPADLRQSDRRNLYFCVCERFFFPWNWFYFNPFSLQSKSETSNPEWSHTGREQRLVPFSSQILLAITSLNKSVIKQIMNLRILTVGQAVLGRKII